MKSELKNLKTILILLISIGVIYLNNLRLDSFIIQKEILADINSSSYVKNIEFINKINKNYPTLTFTTVPIKSIIGKYLLESTDSIEYGKQLILSGIKDNPYLSMGEALIADQYLRESKLDSFRYFTRLAFKKLPNNALNFVMFSNLLKSEEKLDSIIFHFNRISKKINDNQIYNVVLASLVDEEEYKTDALNILDQALEKYPGRNEYLVYDQYLKYTKKNIDLATAINKNAIQQHKNGNIKGSIKLFEEAIKLYPEYQDAIINLLQTYKDEEMYIDLTAMYEEIAFEDILLNNELLLMYMESLYYLNRFTDACDIQKKIDPDIKLQISRNVKSKCT
ncbi:hypothetical protein N9O38_00555 [Flavobacteriaceae bacterium]|nr:hypothetical protein [Flavobacteriaceae bacterium]